MARKNRRGSAALRVVFLLIVILLVGAAVLLNQLGMLPAGRDTGIDTGTDTGTSTVTVTESTAVIVDDGTGMEFHFLEFDNYHTGDCIYVRAGDIDILIDAGAQRSNVGAIHEYLSQYVTDGTLEYVIVTHAHGDHYACFAGSKTYPSLFDLYRCEVVIDFPLTTKKTAEQAICQAYRAQLDEAVAEGTVHYTAAECIAEGRGEIPLGSDMSLTILDSYYYYNVAKDENNHSVCCLFRDGDNTFLFTGDLEADGEQYLTAYNDLPEVTLYKAGHHGSKTSSSRAFLDVIRPDIVCVTCCAGSPEYTKDPPNQFPTQTFIDNIATYTDRIYVTSLYDETEPDRFTSLNGTIIVRSGSDGTVTVTCSASDALLRETDWFRENRTCPDAWKE